MRSLPTIRRFIAFIASTVLATVTLAQSPAPVGIPGAWSLTFQDEFDGAAVDGAKWKLGQSDAGIEGVGGTNPANVSVGGGKLTLTATTAPVDFAGTTFAYSCAELSSYMRFKQAGGYFETRMRWDQATGMWPAFWIMPERDDYGTKEWFSRVFLKWDLAGSGVTSVTSAKLRLKTIVVGNDSKNPNCLQTFAVADDSWAENTINWNNQPVRDPRYLDKKWGFDSAAGDIVEIDVTAWVQSQLAGDGVVSLALADEFRRYRAMRFHSREATNAADRPVLLINDSVSLAPVADAHVKWGTNSTKNYGSTADLEVRTAYQGSNASTFNGGMELDIMETLGIWGNNTTSHAIHWDGYTGSHQVKGWGPVPALATDTTYRTFGCYWVPGQLIEFYVDGVKTGSYTDARAMSVPGYIILSLQLGGWDFNDPTAAVNNKTVDIDYVRVWSGAKSTPAVPTTTTRAANGLITFGTDYTSYAANANTSAEVTVADGGAAVTLHRDSWWKFPLSYTVTPDTVLEFTVDSGSVGEIIGLGLEEDDDSADPKRIFQLAGSQTWSNAWTSYKNYAVQTGPKRYLIPLGTFYTGAMNHLAFANDNDLGNKKVTVRYSDVKIHEGLSDLLFAFDLAFTSGETGHWQHDATQFHADGPSLRSGAITHSQESSLETSLTGPGLLSFWWRTSSQADSDVLHLALDGVDQASLSGDTTWTRCTLHIPAGLQTVRWRYAKDATASSGSDAAWIDDVVYTAQPHIESGVSVHAVIGRPFAYPVNAYNSPESYAATGLPPGLVFDTATGVISGLPTFVGDYTVTVSATNLAGTGATTLTLRVLSPFAAWAEDHALIGELAAPSADADGDGHANLLEYAFGLDPSTADSAASSPLPALSLIDENGAHHLELGFTLPADRAELTYVVQVSENLIAWTNGHAYGASPDNGAALPTVEMENTLAPDGSRRLRVHTLAPTENSRRFLRVGVTQP